MPVMRLLGPALDAVRGNLRGRSRRVAKAEVTVHSLRDDHGEVAVLRVGPATPDRRCWSALVRALRGAVAPGRRIIVDLGAVRTMNSVGLCSLFESRRLAEKASCQLAVAGLRPSLRVLFGVVGLHSFLEVFETVEDAARGLVVGGTERSRRSAEHDTSVSHAASRSGVRRRRLGGRSEPLVAPARRVEPSHQEALSDVSHV